MTSHASFPLEQRTRGGLRVLYTVMRYEKKPIDTSEQVKKLHD